MITVRRELRHFKIVKTYVEMRQTLGSKKLLSLIDLTAETDSLA